MTNKLKKFLVVVFFCCCSSNSFAQVTVGTSQYAMQDCGARAYTGTGHPGTAYESTGSTFSSTYTCNTVKMSDIDVVGSQVLTTTGDNILYYDASTNSYRFINDDETANQVAQASIGLNAALQAAGIGVEFRGWKYQFKVYKSASGTIDVSVKIMGDELQIYAAHYDWSNTDPAMDGVLQERDHPPPYAFETLDEYTIEISMKGSKAGDGIGDMEWTMVYRAVKGHEDDFDPTYNYATGNTFSDECAMNPSYDEDCPGYEQYVDATTFDETDFDGQDDSIDFGIDDSMISGDDGSQVIIEEDTIVLIDESISTGSDDGTQAADDIGLPEIDIGLPVLEDFTLGDITESLVEETLNDVLDDISAGVDLQATTGVDIQETTGIEVIDITGADVLEDITELESVTMPLARPEIIEELEEEILPDEPNKVLKPATKLSVTQRKTLTATAAAAETAKQIAASSSAASTSADGVSNNGDGNFSVNNNTSSSNQTGSTNYGSNNSADISINPTNLEQTDTAIGDIGINTDTALLNTTGITQQDITGNTRMGSSFSFDANSFEVTSSLPLDVVAALTAELELAVSNMLNDTIDDSSNEELNEQTEAEIQMQQSLEDELVAKALEGDTSEDAQAALLGYNPDFRVYVTPQMQDNNFYAPKEIYGGQETYDNPAARFFNGASDEKHRAMVRQQYERN